MTEHRHSLEATAREMVAEGRGILAADESNRTMTERLEGVGAESSEETRRRFASCCSRLPAPRITSAA